MLLPVLVGSRGPPSATMVVVGYAAPASEIVFITSTRLLSVWLGANIFPWVILNARASALLALAMEKNAPPLAVKEAVLGVLEVPTVTPLLNVAVPIIAAFPPTVAFPESVVVPPTVAFPVIVAFWTLISNRTGWSAR